jgi:hypothetical protein
VQLLHCAVAQVRVSCVFSLLVVFALAGFVYLMVFLLVLVASLVDVLIYMLVALAVPFSWARRTASC